MRRAAPIAGRRSARAGPGAARGTGRAAGKARASRRRSWRPTSWRRGLSRRCARHQVTQRYPSKSALVARGGPRARQRGSFFGNLETTNHTGSGFFIVAAKTHDRQVRSNARVESVHTRRVSGLSVSGRRAVSRRREKRLESSHSSKKLATLRAAYSPPFIIISKHHPSANATLSALATALTLAKTFSRSFSSSRGP
jgi:hypothetical protein